MGNSSDTKVLTFEEFCSKFNLEPAKEETKQKYERYRKNLEEQNLSQMHRSGKLPDPLFG